MGSAEYFDPTPTLRAQLTSLRTQLVAMTQQVDAALELIAEQPAPPACPHPEEDREYVKGGTMGSPRRFHCAACDQTVTEPRPVAAGA